MKKTIITIITSILLVLSLCGWKDAEYGWSRNDDIIVFVDEATNVEYVVVRVSHGVGVCPRYNVDGTLMIHKEK